MNKSWRNALIVMGVLIAAYFLNSHFQNRYTTQSSEIYSGDPEDVYKVLIQSTGDAIELSKEADTWVISGNDTLVMRQNRIDNLLSSVLSVNRETMVSKNPENWSKFSVDDSTGTHLALIDASGNTMAYYVFGRSKSDWSHNYVRIEEDPAVYLTDTNVINHLSTKATFWGEVPKPPELPEEPGLSDKVDSTATTEPIIIDE